MNTIVNNAFSTKMLVGDVGCEFLTRFTIISEDEFRRAIEENAKIVIGHPDTADYFGVKMNRETIHLDGNTTLYVCEANCKDGGRLPSGTEFLEQMGKDFYFRFIKVELGIL